MTPLQWDIRRVLKANRDGSRMTQYQRQAMLFRFARDVHDLGHRGKRLPNLGYESNTWFGLKGRSEPVTSKARTLTVADTRQIADPNIRVSLKLQAAFGLRRSEAMKIQPRGADRGNQLVLKGSWTKGGRPREIPIGTQGIAFDRLELDAWVDQYKSRNGRPGQPKGDQLCDARKSPDSTCAMESGISTNTSDKSAFVKALEKAISRKPSNTSPEGSRSFARQQSTE